MPGHSGTGGLRTFFFTWNETKIERENSRSHHACFDKVYQCPITSFRPAMSQSLNANYIFRRLSLSLVETIWPLILSSRTSLQIPNCLLCKTRLFCESSMPSRDVPEAERESRTRSLVVNRESTFFLLPPTLLSNGKACFYFATYNDTAYLR